MTSSSEMNTQTFAAFKMYSEINLLSTFLLLLPSYCITYLSVRVASSGNS